MTVNLDAQIACSRRHWIPVWGFLGVLAAVACSRPANRQSLPPTQVLQVTGTVVPELKGIDGRSSTHVPAQRPVDDSSCISDHGCPFAPALIPTCSGTLQAQSLSEVLASNSNTSKTVVSVVGRLWVQPLQQLVDCSVGCCNLARGTIELRDGEARVPLSDDRYADAFKCTGDDSRVCCGIAEVKDSVRSADVQHQVMVEGTLNREANPAALERPRICQLAEPTLPRPSCEGRVADMPVKFDDTTWCACHDGQARCSNDEGACYLTGVWHRNATVLDIGGDDCGRLCRDGRWELLTSVHPP